jgi:P pilus assembly chaperone PapD
VLSGGNGTASVKVSRVAPGPATTFVTLYASSDGQLDASDVPVLASPAVTKVVSGKTKTVKLKFTYPSGDGPVYLIARASASAEPNAAPGSTDNVAAAATPVTVAPANAAINVTSLAVSPASLVIGKKGSATLLVTNAGNVPYKGNLQVALFASANAAEGDDVPLAALAKRVSIRPGATKRVKIKFTLPVGFELPSFQPVAQITPAPIAGVTVTGSSLVGSQVVAVVS